MCGCVVVVIAVVVVLVWIRACCCCKRLSRVLDLREWSWVLRLVGWQVFVVEGGSSMMESERKRGKGRKEVRGGDN